MIFRWSIWGDHISKNIELLRYSILSFKKQFGNNHQYVVYTDNAEYIKRYLDKTVDIRQFPTGEGSLFRITSKATWLKWCPSSRMDIDQTEFFVDSDVFLLKYPKEIDLFLSNPDMKFAIMDEFFGQSWQHGTMRKKATLDTPFVNAGFFIQKTRCDISGDLIKEFEWWQKNIKSDEQTHHDEQGALAIALTKYFISGELYILPKDTYVLIGENENTNISNLDDITLFHAVYPNHSAFYKFKNFLDNILYEQLRIK
ncbi:hypothetical protein KJ866_02715 [Patescibacteria group bacterium]|nr:hypothetical protein [Patescibacteria group bacterium]